MIAKTWKLNEIFKSYEDFKSFFDECVSAGEVTYDDKFLWPMVYMKLMLRYGQQQIAYDQPETFLSELALLLIDNIGAYYKRLELTKELYEFSEEDWTKIRDALTSLAVSNNAKLVDPKKWVGFVGSQSHVYENAGKVDAYLNALRQMPRLGVDNFLNSFKNLFVTFHTPKFCNSWPISF